MNNSLLRLRIVSNDIHNSYWFVFVSWTVTMPFSYKVMFLLYGIDFFMGSIFCFSVVLVWTFNIRGAYNCILARKANIPVNLILFFSGVSFLFYPFLKSGVTNELKGIFLVKSKKVRVIYSQQYKTLLLKRWFGQHKYGAPLQ